MHFHRPCWWLTAALFLLLGHGPNPGALAGGLAGCYERLLAYTITGAAKRVYGVHQQRYFPKGAPMRGTAADGGLNWVEYVQALNEKGPINPKFIAPGSDLDNPYPKSAADMLWRASAPVKGEKIPSQAGMIELSDIVPNTVSPNPKFPDFIDYSSKILKEVKKFHVRTNTFDEWTALETRLTTIKDEIIKLRRSDIVQHMAADMKKKWPKAVVVVDETPYDGDAQKPDRKILTLNMEETIKKSPAGTFDVEGAKEFVKNYGLEEPEKVPGQGKKKHDPAYTHQRVIKAYDGAFREIGSFCS